ncbi:MAG: hypothetical protein JSR17_07195 [Proteobacteria bacterium]|nr:hypothetical protein [Pseudomonadota bacterium]
MVFKSKISAVFLLLSFFSGGLYAVADCKSILAKLPKHNPQTNDQAKMVENFEKQCHERPNATDPNVLKECLTVGMRSMAVSGNYVAAEKMAKIECDAGNDALSKTWMGMIMNNQNASPEDRSVAEEALSNKE